MGEAPHEVYTDAELKARAEKVCGNCKFFSIPSRKQENAVMGTCSNAIVWDVADIEQVSKDFGCIHFEPK